MLYAMLLTATFMASPAPDIVVYADVVHSVTADPIQDGYVLIQDGHIAAIGAASEATLTGDEHVVRCAIVTPGFVDARATVGLTGQYNIPHDQDMLEHSHPMQPELRAMDAFNPQERLVEWVREFGTTTVHTGHAPGELISGRTMICKTSGNTVSDAIIVPDAMIACTLGESSLKKGEKSPGNRSKSVALLRQRLIEADEYTQSQTKAGQLGDDGKSKDPPKRDLQLEALAAVLAGDMPLMIHAHRSHDIMNAIRLANEFEIDVVLDGGAESYRVIDELKAAEIPVIIHPQLIRMYGELENASFTTASKLADAGIPMAMQTGYESYVPKVRVLVFEAAQAAANGLGPHRALRACTIDAATLLGIDDRVGSLEVGKDADLALWDGDPFEWTTHCTGVIIDGQQVSTVVR